MTQIYISWRESERTASAPVRQLAWFKRYNLQPDGRDATIDFEIDARSMALWIDGGWHISGGE